MRRDNASSFIQGHQVSGRLVLDLAKMRFVFRVLVAERLPDDFDYVHKFPIIAKTMYHVLNLSQVNLGNNAEKRLIFRESLERGHQKTHSNHPNKALRFAILRAMLVVRSAQSSCCASESDHK